MKPNEFVTEGITDLITKGIGNLSNKLNAPTGNDPRKPIFAKNFATQLQQQLQAHPNININDFMQLYWKRNGWDPSHLPAGYQASLKNALNSLPPNPTFNDFKKLGSAVFNLATIMPSARYGQQVNAQQAQGAPQNAQQAQQSLDPSTNQIIAKIRSMKNTPEEIDDLEYIVNIALIKLNKVDPQNYPKIAKLLFNNGGNPSTTMKRMQKAQQTIIPRTPVAQNNTPNYSGGQRQVTPNVTSFNTNATPAPVASPAVANTQVNPQTQATPATNATQTNPQAQQTQATPATNTTQTTQPTTNKVKPAGNSKDVPPLAKVEPKLNPAQDLAGTKTDLPNVPDMGDFSKTDTGSNGPELGNLTSIPKFKEPAKQVITKPYRVTDPESDPSTKISRNAYAKRMAAAQAANDEMDRNDARRSSKNDAGLPQWTQYVK